MDGNREQPAGGGLWQRNFVLAILVNFALAIIFYLFTTTMAVYAIKQFRVSEIGGGLAAGAFVIGAVIARLFGGKYLDLLGRRRVLIASLVAAVAVSLGHLFVESYSLLIVFRLLHGITFGSASSAVTTIAFSLIPPPRRGEGTSYFAVSTTLGSAIGPIMAVAFSDTFGSGSLFLIGGFVPLVALGLAVIMNAKERILTDSERAAVKTFRWRSLIDWGTLPISVLMVIPGIAFATVLAFIETYGIEHDMEGSGAKYFAIYAASVLVSRLFVGRMQDTLGDNVVLIPIFIALAGSLFALVFLPPGVAVVTSGILLGMGFGAIMPSIQTIAVRIGLPQNVALVTSTFFLLTDLGVGFGPIIAGALIHWLDLKLTFFILGTLVILSIFLYWRLHGRKQRHK